MTADVEQTKLTQEKLDNYETRELRRWAIESAIGVATRGLLGISIVATAHEFEQYVLNGHAPKGEPDGNR